ncbi:hypothetical protein EV360DRAFT_78682 [Lentinula raphanica]|nr:hypothetical protein EV360DRAFT_78682 [Lentinula raphanica]
MYPKHLAFTVFFTLGIFPSISMGAPMGNVNAEIIEGRAVKVIAASARPVKGSSPPRANVFAQSIDARSPRMRNEQESQFPPPPSSSTSRESTPPPPPSSFNSRASNPPSATTFNVAFDQPGIETFGGILIRDHTRELVAKAADHWQVGTTRVAFGESYPNIHPDWSHGEITDKEFEITVTGGRCSPQCKGVVHMGGTSKLKDVFGITVAEIQ